MVIVLNETGTKGKCNVPKIQFYNHLSTQGVFGCWNFNFKYFNNIKLQNNISKVEGQFEDILNLLNWWFMP